MKCIQEFKSIEEVAEEYGRTKEDTKAILDQLNRAKVYLAWYGYGYYEGSSLVIYELDGKLYEVNGSHCSCYGLEGQWQPEETSWKAIGMRDYSNEDYSGWHEAQEEINRLVKENTPSVN